MQAVRGVPTPAVTQTQQKSPITKSLKIMKLPLSSSGNIIPAVFVYNLIASYSSGQVGHRLRMRAQNTNEPPNPPWLPGWVGAKPRPLTWVESA